MAAIGRFVLVWRPGTSGADVPEGAWRFLGAAARGSGLRVRGQREPVGEYHRTRRRPAAGRLALAGGRGPVRVGDWRLTGGAGRRRAGTHVTGRHRAADR